MSEIDLNALDALLSSLSSAKQDELDAKDRRIAIENEVIAMVGKKEEGTQTIRAVNYKVNTVDKLSRKVNWTDYDVVVSRSSLPANMLPVKIKREIDVKKLETIEKDYPDLYAEISNCITYAPLKTYITVKPIEDKA